ncbi:MAG: hypothetical protein EXQ49_01475 [Acidobacteria bacterium]|nr:hypothetical protein [Acidobacteriota bacterium]
MSSETAPARDLAAALAWGLDQAVEADALALSAFLAQAFGPSSLGIIHYGSRAQGRKPRADSAFDFFVVVDRYGDAYRSLSATVGTSYSPKVATALAHVLAPNVISVTDRAARAKCCVISLADFRRACSPRRRDHFVQGRLCQFVLLSWTRDAASARAIGDAIAEARAATYAWSRPSLPETFTVDEFLQAALSRSLAGETRPESGDHARTLVAAQRDALCAIYTPLLDHLVAQGALARASVIYRQQGRASAVDRLRVRSYFRLSKVRATVRLLKHVILYEGWLDYIVRKIERSGGTKMVLTSREQRWPLIFLWPRVFRYLRDRPQRQRPRDSD